MEYMIKYRLVQAIQWNGDNTKEIEEFLKDSPNCKILQPLGSGVDKIEIEVDGYFYYYIRKDRFIVKNWKNEVFHIMDSNQFNKHYTPKEKEVVLDSGWDIATDLHDFTPSEETREVFKLKNQEEPKQPVRLKDYIKTAEMAEKETPPKGTKTIAERMEEVERGINDLSIRISHLATQFFSSTAKAIGPDSVTTSADAIVNNWENTIADSQGIKAPEDFNHLLDRQITSSAKENKQASLQNNFFELEKHLSEEWEHETKCHVENDYIVVTERFTNSKKGIKKYREMEASKNYIEAYFHELKYFGGIAKNKKITTMFKLKGHPTIKYTTIKWDQ